MITVELERFAKGYYSFLKFGRVTVNNTEVENSFCVIGLILKGQLEKQIGNEFDSTLSQKIDCITFLIEN